VNIKYQQLLPEQRKAVINSRKISIGKMLSIFKDKYDESDGIQVKFNQKIISNIKGSLRSITSFIQAYSIEEITQKDLDFVNDIGK
jgi:hypothetical protein